MICDKCKTEVSPEAKFCPSCGAKVESTQPAMAQSSAEGITSAVSETKQAEAPPQPNVERPAPSYTAQPGSSQTSKGPLVAVILLVLLVIAGSAGYLYYAGFIGKTPAKLGEQINNELKEKGLNLYCEVDKNWTATLKGSVKNAADKETARNIVKAHKEVKDVKDELQPQISPSDLKLAIDNALTGVGLMDIRADVDENLVATLHGTALSESDKADAVKTAKAVDKVRDVKDNILVQAVPPMPETSSQPSQTLQEPKQKRRDTARSLQEPKQERRETASQPPVPAEQPRQKRRDTARPYEGPSGLYGDTQGERPGAASLDPFDLEVRINRALQKAGLRRVRAKVGERFNVFMNGRVDSEEEKARAVEIARSFNGTRNVRDRIVVAGH